MYCKVLFHNHKAGGFSGRIYTYSTQLDLKVGDKVLCPIAKESEPKRALVTEINVPESEIEDSWRDRIKEIRDYDYTDMQPVR